MATALAISLEACGAGVAKDCTETSGARLCLSRGSPAKVTATGLQPGSPVATKLEGSKVKGPGLAPRPAGPDGKFPTAGVSSGVVNPEGSGPVTVTITITPRGGTPATVTFHR